jgi:integrase
LDIYNFQSKVSKSGKAYLARTKVWAPGQAGRLSEADQKPPFITRNYRPDLGDEWPKLRAQTIQEAKTEVAAIEAKFTAAAAGVDILEVEAPAGETLEGRVREYLEECRATKKDQTYNGYANVLENYFLKSCKKRLLADVNRKDLLAFKTYLASADRKPRLTARTQSNYILYTMIFLKWADHKVDFAKSEWPKFTERKVEEYSDDEIKKLLQHSEGDDRLKMLCLLTSGMRNGELANLTYGDIDFEFSVWGVNPKTGWDPKTTKGTREVPVPRWLSDEIEAKQKRLGAKRTDYIFPVTRGTRKGRPYAKGFRSDFIQRAAKKAGLEGRFDCHKFRSTAATNWLRNATSLPDAMAFMGHKHADTMQRYAAAVKIRDKEAHQKTTGWADRFQAAS